MTWAQFDDNWYDSPSFAGLDIAALGLWSVGKTYCNRHGTDGKIPASFPKKFGAKGAKAANDLVRAGRWSINIDGSFDHVGYLDHNLSKAEVEERKAAKTATKAAAGRIGGLKSAALRSKQKASTCLEADEAEASTRRKQNQAQGEERSGEVKSLDLSAQHSPPLQPISSQSARAEILADPEPADPLKGEPAWRAAYEAGIEAGTGEPYSFPTTRTAQGDLNTVLPKFARAEGKAIGGEKLVAWIAEQAQGFARAVIASGANPDHWSGYAPAGFKKYLNQSRTIKPAESGRHVVQQNLNPNDEWALKAKAALG